MSETSRQKKLTLNVVDIAMESDLLFLEILPLALGDDVPDFEVLECVQTLFPLRMEFLELVGGISTREMMQDVDTSGVEISVFLEDVYQFRDRVD